MLKIAYVTHYTALKLLIIDGKNSTLNLLINILRQIT